MKKIAQKIAIIGVLSLLLGGAGQAFADEAGDIAAVRQVLSKLVPRGEPDRVTATPLPGIYEAVYGTQILYLSADGKYMLQGDLFDLAARQNLSENARKEGRKSVISQIDPDSMIVYAPEQTKHVVTTFTDIDCSFCRKMHKQMAEYNQLGIEFRYLAYPRSGPNSPSYFKAVTVWCSENPQQAMTRAKSGEKLPNKECDNPVIDHMAAARAVGVSGTPSLILENGQMVPGYVEPKRLLKMLEESAGF